MKKRQHIRADRKNIFFLRFLRNEICRTTSIIDNEWTSDASETADKQKYYENISQHFITITILLAPGTAIVSAQEHEKAFGELKIEGSQIESVVLRSLDNNHTETFEPPFEARKIPVGKYRLQNIRLEGGYYCGTKNHITVSVEESETAIFKVGAPLKSTIDVKRQGRILELRYKLIGMAGEDYPSPTRNNPPCFAVFKADKKIKNGVFHRKCRFNKDLQ